MQLKTMLASTIALGVFAAPALAANRTFDNDSSDGKWSTPSNWSGNQMPVDGDTAIIPNGFTCNVDITTARADAVTVQTGGLLIVRAGMILEIDSASSVADAQGIQLAGSGSVLKASGSLTFSGTGSIDGQHNDARIEIAANQTLTLTSTFEGRMQIKGLPAGAVGTAGAFTNNGTVNANDGAGSNGVIIVDVNTVLNAATGLWTVSQAGAKLEFNAGSACGTEIGNLTVGAGTAYFKVHVTVDLFTFNGGVLNGDANQRLRYDSYAGSQGNPQEGTDCSGSHEYVQF